MSATSKEDHAEWSCPACTFLNRFDAMVCGMCNGPRPYTAAARSLGPLVSEKRIASESTDDSAVGDGSPQPAGWPLVIGEIIVPGCYATLSGSGLIRDGDVADVCRCPATSSMPAAGWGRVKKRKVDTIVRFRCRGREVIFCVSAPWPPG